MLCLGSEGVRGELRKQAEGIAEETVKGELRRKEVK